MGIYKKTRQRGPQAPYGGELPMLDDRAYPRVPLPSPDLSETEEIERVRSSFRSFSLPISSSTGVGEVSVQVSGPAMVKFTDIGGLQASEPFSARISARPLGARGLSSAVQDAPQLGGLSSQLSSIYLPQRGEWILRVSMRSAPAQALVVAGQVFEGVGPDHYAATLALPSSGRSSQADVFAGSDLRIFDQLNVSRVRLMTNFDTTVRLGVGNPEFIVKTGTIYDFEVALQSLVVVSDSVSDYLVHYNVMET